MSLTSGHRIGPYKIVAPLGAGGMGEVYRARDSKLKREVALKVLPADVANDQERLARFQREAEVLASLNHPHIAQVYGIEENALVMELVEGEDLAERLKRGAIPIDEALPIARQIAEALEAAHDAGIVHRDLKPANVKLRPDGTVKVLDFGLAKALETGSGIGDPGSANALANSPTITSPAMTMRGVILGTAAYMAPEQAKGKLVDRRADIWAFGCVLYEMLTARRTFKGDDVTDIITSVMRDTPDWNALPPTTPPAIRTLLRRCLEKDPRKRAPHMGIARLDIDDAMTTTGESLPGVAVAKKRGLSYAAVAAIALACMGIAGGAAWTLGRPADPGPRPVIKASWPLDSDIGLRPAMQRNILGLSRNGKALVVIGSGVMVRRTDQLAWTQIPNTRDATSVFASPDGEWIGIVTRSGIAKVPAAGGTPVSIFQLQDTATFGAFGVAWGDDDRVFFTDRAGVHVVPSAGGAAQTIAGGPDYGAIDVLPGSHHLLVTRGRVELAAEVVLMSLDGRGDVLVHEAIGPKFVAPDLLLFLRRGALMGVRVDVAARRTAGEPIPLVEDVATLSTAGQYGVSADGTLVYLPASSETSGLGTLQVQPAKGGVQPLHDSARRYSDPRLSPDGRRLALHIVDQQDDIWVFDLARRALTRLTFDPGEDETPAWSPDGQWIAFASEGRDGGQRAVIRRRADGSGAEETIWTSADHSHVADWSPDGRTVLVELAHPQRRSDVMAVDIATRTATPVLATPFNEACARLSPDGKWLLYQSDESGRPEIYLQSFPALSGKVQVSTQGAEQPVWSPDGRAVYFRTETHVARAAVTVAGAALSVGIPVMLFPDTFLRPQAVNHTTIDVTADGSVILIQPVTAPVREAVIIGVFNWLDEVRQKMGPR